MSDYEKELAHLKELIGGARVAEEMERDMRTLRQSLEEDIRRSIYILCKIDGFDMAKYNAIMKECYNEEWEELEAKRKAEDKIREDLY